MKISTLAVATLVTSLSAAIIAPAVYAEDAAAPTTTTTTTTTPAPACDPKDPKCKPDAATTEGAAAPTTEAPATGSDS